jgi:hypothetical protein
MGYISDSLGFGAFSCGADCSCKQCRSNLAEVYEEEEPSQPTPVNLPIAPKMAGWFGQPPLFQTSANPYGQSQFGIAIALPIVGAIALAVIEAIAFVASALAAAYLLIQAYEAAKARGFGVAQAQQALTAGLGALIAAAEKAIQLLSRLRQLAPSEPPPNSQCANALADALRTGLEIRQIIGELKTELIRSVPRIQRLRPLMDRLRSLISRIEGELRAIVRACGKTPI